MFKIFTDLFQIIFYVCLPQGATTERGREAAWLESADFRNGCDVKGGRVNSNSYIRLSPSETFYEISSFKKKLQLLRSVIFK